MLYNIPRKEFIKLDMNLVNPNGLTSAQFHHWERVVRKQCSRCLNKKYILHFKSVNFVYDDMCKQCVKKIETFNLVLNVLKEANII